MEENKCSQPAARKNKILHTQIHKGKEKCVNKNVFDPIFFNFFPLFLFVIKPSSLTQKFSMP